MKQLFSQKYVLDTMKSVSKRNKNGLFWKIGHNKAVIIFDCRDAGIDDDTTPPKTAEELFALIVNHTVVFKNKQLAERLFDCSFSEIKESMFHELCDEVFDKATDSCVMNYDNYYLLIDLKLKMLCVTDSLSDIEKFSAPTATEATTELQPA
jgi:hypothetical protein